MTNKEIGLIETSELMKLSKEELQKMLNESKEEFNKINDEEQGKEKTESLEIAVKQRDRVETALWYAQYEFPTNPTCGSHELGPLPTWGITE